MKRLAQNPPSEGRVKLVLAVIVLCLCLFAVERLFGLPDWMQMAPRGLRWTPE